MRSVVIERNKRDALVGGVLLGEADRPAARLPELIVVGFPLVGDTGAAVGDQAGEIRMVGNRFTRLFKRVFDRGRGADAILPDRDSRASRAGRRRPKVDLSRNATRAPTGRSDFGHDTGGCVPTRRARDRR